MTLFDLLSAARSKVLEKPSEPGKCRTAVGHPGSLTVPPPINFDESRSPAPRRGAVLVCVMVCLLCVSALVANMLQSIIRVQKQLKLEQTSRQVELLVDAGRIRAAHKLSTDEAYLGETWCPQPDAFGRGTDSAAVTIAVEPAPNGQSNRVQVTAEYPADSPYSVRRSQRFVVSAVP